MELNTLCEAMKVKPGLCWRPQDIEMPELWDATKESCRLGVEPCPREREVCCSQQTESSWRSEEHFDIRHGDGEFGGFPTGFLPCFGPEFSYYAPFPPFGMVIYILCHCMLET